MSDSVKFILVMFMFCMPLAGLTMAVDCPAGDLYPDCKIDIQDLSLFAVQWLDISCSGPSCADLTGGDGVNITDFSVLANNWQQQQFPLMINEFMAKNDSFVQDPTGDYDDWIEIHNYSGASVDIAGMYLTDKPADPLQWWQVPFGSPAETTIPPQGFIVIWADEQLTEGPLHANFKLSASGETIALIDPDSVTVDSITFTSSQALSNESYGRATDAAVTWQIFTAATTVPSPGQSNGSPTIDIVINEVMYHPSSELDAEEYIELYNNGNGPVNLAGWQFSEGVAYTFGNVTIDSGNYLVVAADVAAFAAKYPSVTNVVGGWSGKLSNNSEDIELLNSLGVRIDRIDYADQGDWSIRQLGPLDYGHRGWEWSDDHDGGGKSLELIDPGFENAYGQNWKTSTAIQGTPGVVNSVATSNIAPVILDVKHTPKVPNSTDAVIVTANVIDELSAISTVTLYYRLDTSTYSTNVYPAYNPASYTTLTMYDDGAHGDDLAADGVYGATIPAQADSAIVEFFVKADDATANSRTWPDASIIDGTPEQVTNVLYQVDDDFDAAAVWQGGSRPVYRLVMTKAENDRLKDIGDGEGGEQQSNAQMNATFISIDGTDIKDRYNVGVRNRGQSSRTGPPNNYRVNFVHDAKWKKLSAMTINYSYPYSQLIGNVIFKMAGLTAPDAQDIRLIVNGEDISTLDNNMFGSYVQIETFGGDFVDHHFPADSDGNLYKAAIWCQSCTPTQWIAGLYYEGPNPSDYTSAGYYKNTNEEYNDWSDLINLTNILDNAPDETYSAQVEAVVDVDQWITWFAVNNLIGNNETSLGNGRGDDYRLYMGINDPRAKLIVHDMDTVLGLGDTPNDAQDSIFRAADPVHLPIIERFLKHPDFAPMYYAQLMELCETVFSPEQFDPVIDRVLGDRLPQSTIDALKQFAVDRVANVLTQIPLDLTATSSLSISDSLFKTTSNSGSLSGYANAIDTRAVTVNTLPAIWNAADAQWTFDIAGSGLILNPGINRLKVQSYSDVAAINELDHEFIDIWYDTASETTFAGGTLASNTTLDLASSPWRITSAITVPAGVTLTIEPGTTVYFNSGTGVTVNGRLLAEGTEYQRIRLSRVPNSGASWNGLIFQNSLNDSRLAHIDMSYGHARGDSIRVEYSQVLIDNMTWPNSTLRAIEVLHPSLLVRNSIFHGINGEVIHGEYIENSEYLTLENNIFERGHTGGDIIDFLGAERPGPVFKVIDNIFYGGPDDGIDLDGTDAHVEGNIFMDFRKETTRDTTSNCIATGLPQTGGTNRTEVTIARNIFHGGDHAILLKEEAFATIENNVFVGMDIAAIQFNEIGGTANMGPSNGADIDGNIFFGNADLFQNQFSPDLGQWPDPVITVNNSIIDTAMHTLGVDNIDADPSFVDNDTDFSLMSKSAGIGTGPNARDMGAFPVAGATVSGEPGPVTHQTTVTLTVDGPGISHYQYRLMDNGAWADAWSGEFTVDTPITLTSLQNGHSYTVYAKGRSIDDVWPGDPAGNASHTWTVDVDYSKLMINEVLAHSHGTDPDIIELYCEGTSTIDMGDMSITDDPAAPRKYVFPAGTTINPGQYLVYYADLLLTPGHLGFSLYSNGEGLYLYDKPANGGGLIDSVEFGIQPNGISIGRVGFDKQWKLTYQTFGQANQVCPLDNPKNIKINEWLASGGVLFEDDFIELYNPGQQPVDISGFFISDDAAAKPDKHRFADLSFILPQGYLYLFADDDETEGADHLNFNLSSDSESITLADQELNVIDKVAFLSQTTDVSEGRVPDGADQTAFFDLPTPGTVNSTVTVTTTKTNVLDFYGADWSYNQSGANLGTSWSQIGYDDSSWPTGGALLYVENSPLPATKTTPLTLGPVTFYFRTHFTLTEDPASFTALEMTTVLDDAAIVYINGQEATRIGMPAGAVNYLTLASRTIYEASIEYFTIPTDALVQGDNVIAVEVHQIKASSSDIVFGLSLDSVVTTVTQDDLYGDDIDVLNGLRITEMMYNPPIEADLEYIELKNISDKAIDITDVRFVDGIDYQFPAMTLAPGEYVVIAADETKFEAQYSGVDAVGQYIGRLNNGGERIVLTLANPPLEAAVMRFDYNNTWYPATDGAGSALEIIDPTADPALWDDAESWQAITPSPGGP